MGKGSGRRPGEGYEEQHEKIDWSKPEGMGVHPMCGFPFCDCNEKCEEADESTND